MSPPGGRPFLMAGGARTGRWSRDQGPAAPVAQASTWWTLTHLLLDVAVGTVVFTVVFALLVTSVVLLLTFPWRSRWRGCWS